MINLRHTAAAFSKSAPNLLNNGGFIDYLSDVVRVPVTADNWGYVEYRDIQLSKYRPKSAVFPVSIEKLKESPVAYWDFYGVSGVVEISPPNSQQIPMRCVHGGYLIRVVLNSSGEMIIEQTITDSSRLSGQGVSVGFTGVRLFPQGSVTLRILADDNIRSAVTTQVSSMGSGRRIVTHGSIPVNTNKVVCQLVVAGPSGMSVGIGAVSAYCGPATGAAVFSNSIADVTIPSGLVILYEGEACPPGYVSMSEDKPAMVLVSGSSHLIGSGEPTVGSDSHDHSASTDALDATGDFSQAPHALGPEVPDIYRNSTHTPLFGTQPQFPNEQPVKALSVTHNHTARTAMSAVPPSFPLRICRKL